MYIFHYFIHNISYYRLFNFTQHFAIILKVGDDMENSMDISIGKVWKKARKSKGFTQEYSAEKLGLGARYISDLERDKTLGSITTLVNLCNLYDVTPTYILQDYLNIKKDLKIDLDLIGFFSLNNRDKDIVINLIKFLNSRK